MTDFHFHRKDTTMTQADLNRQVAGATGESVREIRRLGFSLADTLHVDHDPEPSPVDELEKYLDWDLPDRRRHMLLPVN
jgi:hypothetical protein